jgi:hypothetical protein
MWRQPPSAVPGRAKPARVERPLLSVALDLDFDAIDFDGMTAKAPSSGPCTAHVETAALGCPAKARVERTLLSVAFDLDSDAPDHAALLAVYTFPGEKTGVQMPPLRRKHVEYEVSIVAYVDILGFRDLVQMGTAGEISRNLRLVREAIKPGSSTAKLYQLYYQSFSDLTVIAIPLLTPANVQFHPGLLEFQLGGLVGAQSKLIRNGILLRGAVVVGSIVKSYKQLFGPAMIKAYDIERAVAKFPRIVVDDSVMRETKRNPLLLRDPSAHPRGITTFLRRDEDGQMFIDYLREPYWLSGYQSFLRTHGDLILERLEMTKDNKDVRQKYEWMARYHNRTISDLLRAEPRRRNLKALKIPGPYR